MPDTSLRRLVVRYYGGLGNQIFQYAAGLYFAERASIPFESVRPVDRPEALQSKGYARPFQLDEFTLKGTLRTASGADRFYLATGRRSRAIQNKLRHLSKALSIESIEEPSAHRFLPTFLDQVGVRTVYLIGHWQAAGYAEAVSAQLRESLQLRNQPKQRNLDYERTIRAMKCPVSVHIRVGDYALHRATESDSGKQVTWVLRKSYYRKAIARIRTLFPDSELVVFSDDPPAAQAMMNGELASLWVSGNEPANAFEEMWLMSCCKHHVIANSSFSWWGAWLNPDPDKVVLAPKHWFNTQDSYYPELFPPRWEVIDNLL
jgi:hypothetical protein